MKSRELLSWFANKILDGLANAVGFTLSIVSCDEHYPDSPKKIALRLELLADRVLAAFKRTVLQIEQTRQFLSPNPSQCWNRRWGSHEADSLTSWHDFQELS
jgi:hypothetical protein